MIEERRIIVGFPRYEVSNLGKVYNLNTSREMFLSPTIQGVLTVGLMYEGKQYRRSVKVLVARAFVAGESDIFDTPVQLDNDQTNLAADNIVWRPRWFAWRYSHQFVEMEEWCFGEPVVDLTTGEEFPDIITAAMTNGNLAKHVKSSIFDGRRVFPMGERYTYKKMMK